MNEKDSKFIENLLMLSSVLAIIENEEVNDINTI